jgi:plasmid maintenance system antidote protein VapI
MTATDNPVTAPVHPGEMLMEDVLGPLGFSQ